MSTYRRCSRCVMDTTDPDIFFDEKAFCNRCTKYFGAESRFVSKGHQGKKKMETIVKQIKEAGKGKDYDCVLGVSGARAHLPNLICSGQISRSEAVEELEKPLYSEEELAQDKQYVLGRLGLSEEEFEQIMDLPIKKHSDYGSDEWIYEILRRLERVYRFFGGTR